VAKNGRLQTCTIASAILRPTGKCHRRGAALVRRPLFRILTATLGICASSPAAAQVAGVLSIDSDFRLRGYSLSSGRPVASARIGLDDISGFYADGSATATLNRHEDVRVLGYQIDAGIAKRLSEDWSVDVGIAHNQLRAAYPGGRRYVYSEGYAGVARGQVSAYVFVSPNYLRSGFWTVYGQVEESFAPAKHLTLTAHFGALGHVSTPVSYALRHKTSYDWRVGATRESENLAFHINISGGGPGRQYYYGSSHSRVAVVAGCSFSL